MKLEDFEAIMDNEKIGGSLLREPGDNAMKGLLIITKYLPTAGIGAAEHDVIYSVSSDRLVEAGITAEDAVTLRRLNWMIDEESLACFV